MSQAEKKRRSGSILTRLPGTLALGTVFGLGFGGCLPLHVAGGVVAPIAERNPMVYHIAPTFACRESGSGTRVITPELMFSAVCPEKVPPLVTDTSLTLLGSERRNDKQ